MKAKKFLGKLVLVGMVILAGLGVFYNQPQKVEARQEARIEQSIENTRNEIDLQKLADQGNMIKGQNFINSISNKVEIKCLSFNNTYKATFDNVNANSLTEVLADNKLHVQLDYHASLDIDTNKIQFDIDTRGNVSVYYSMEDIKCEGISVDKHDFTEQKSWFAKSRSKENLIAIIELSSDRVVEHINQDETLLTEANKALQDYLKDIATSMGVRSINFNGEVTHQLNKVNFQ
ncbi:MAG: hypothetical protein ACRCX8_14320 [Sarcina sp.]